MYAANQTNETAKDEKAKAFAQGDKNVTKDVKEAPKKATNATDNATIAANATVVLEAKPVKPQEPKFDAYKTEIKQGLYKPKPGIHINPEKDAAPLNVVRGDLLRDTVDLNAPRMTADNAKKVVAKVEEKKVVEATNVTKDANATTDAKKPTKKSEKVANEKADKKDAKPQALSQGIVASDIFKPTH